MRCQFSISWVSVLNLTTVWKMLASEVYPSIAAQCLLVTLISQLTLVDNLCEEIGWNLATYQTNIYWYACQLKCPLSNSQCRPIVPNIHQPSGRSRPSDKGVGRSSRPWDKGGHISQKIREGSPGSATASANGYLATKLHRPACQLSINTPPPILNHYLTDNSVI